MTAFLTSQIRECLRLTLTLTLTIGCFLHASTMKQFVVGKKETLLFLLSYSFCSQTELGSIIECISTCSPKLSIRLLSDLYLSRHPDPIALGGIFSLHSELSKLSGRQYDINSMNHQFAFGAFHFLFSCLPKSNY